MVGLPMSGLSHGLGPRSPAYHPAVADPNDHALPAIGRVVQRCVTYHRAGLEPGSHLRLPSPFLTVVLSIGRPTRLSAMPGPLQQPGSFMALVGGLHMRPAVIAYDAEMCGIQLDLTPQGARNLFGLPSAQLAHSVFDMDDVLGPATAELLDRLHEADSWAERVLAVDDILGRRSNNVRSARPHVDQAWRLLMGSAGTISIVDLAAAVGWSRRHLDQEFSSEFGLSPKAVARLARFAHSRELLQRRPQMPLADLSARCGYYDQAHMAREWNLLAGMPASAWWAEDGVRFFQASAQTVAAS